MGWTATLEYIMSVEVTLSHLLPSLSHSLPPQVLPAGGPNGPAPPAAGRLTPAAPVCPRRGGRAGLGEGEGATGFQL